MEYEERLMKEKRDFKGTGVFVYFRDYFSFLLGALVRERIIYSEIGMWNHVFIAKQQGRLKGNCG